MSRRAQPTRTVLQEMVDKGMSDPQIGRELSVTGRTVLRWRTAFGIESKWQPPVPNHGTTARYHRGCRCTRCSAANTRTCREYRARRKSGLIR